MTMESEHPQDDAAAASDKLILSLHGLKKHFPIKEGALQRVVGQVRAVDGVSFDIRSGETVGLVGESGCGKTTLGRCVSGLTDPSDGAVYFNITEGDRDRVDALRDIPDEQRSEQEREELAALDEAHCINQLNEQARRHYRRNCQVVFQDAFASLNPRHLVNDIVGRPLQVYGEASGSELTTRTVQLLEQVGLGSQHLYRYPHQFSGGQRQRISIARALALNPELIILDEPTSALDVSVQAQILNLLHELQRERNLAYLFITHDLSVVRHMADRIVVMYLGKVVEAGRTQDIFERPQHPYTKALLAASPDLSDDTDTEIPTLEGTVPDPAHPPQGCRFHTRCPVATPACGWDVDDVVRGLENQENLFDGLSAVNRVSPFEAQLTFDNEASARALADTLHSNAISASMREALEEAVVRDRTINIRFNPAEEVELTERAPGHIAACVLDPAAR
ncbi:MAG: ATP-binding cassette domain-containing protein [Alphaproteobacteria bacterium]|nr:ATP-binding cassette domain-containing protein [Alphaproteobacteria bacterium]